MKYLITGATGFLGQHVLTQLQEQNRQAKTATGGEPRHVVLVRDTHKKKAAFEHVDVISGSLADSEKWEDDPRLVGVTGIFHLAAVVQHSRYRAQHVYDANIQGTLNMVQLAKKLNCRLVYVSTSGTVGAFPSADASADEHAPFCAQTIRGWPYYHSKMLAEQKSRALADALGVSMVTLRPPMMLGPGDARFRATGQIVRFLRGKLPFILRGGIHYIDIRDAASAMIRAMQHPSPKSVYHLPGTACSIETFFADLASISNNLPPKYHLPFRLAWGISQVNALLHQRLSVPSLLPDPVVIEMANHFWGIHSLYAAADLGFQSREGLETLRDTVSWIRAHRDDC